ncbi:MAG: type VI secretion system membrane subunit TssM [Rubrivivax sp.]|nr:type VI secretion system membrane subunit TssM [Rubrivivax sp.]
MNWVRAHPRLLAGGFVVLVLALIVLLLGPRLGSEGWRPLAPVANRLVVVLLLVLIWVGVEGLLRWLAQRRERRLMADLAAGSEADEADRAASAESEQLKQRFTQALTTLRSGRSAAGRQLLYDLPWYLFVGAPGSGKTTALLNCGLRFPLAGKAGGTGAADVELKGVGGTRNCDWLFAEQAVLIDTAGRYVTQDSHEKVDQRAWQTFLGLLKRHRPRQPINGVIVTLSIHDLLNDDAARRAAYAQQVRQRLEELQKELGLQFPVYVMVTKMDLVAGFSEFFASFDPEQRAQVWGSTFDFDLETRVAQPARAGFDAAFPGLVERINQLLLVRLQEERDVERRAVMYAFPQQFAALGPLISGFLEQAFSDSRYAQPLVVRGLYFTSGTQFGVPIDRLIQGLAQSLDVAGASAGWARPQATAVAKSYFIQRLLSDVIFREAGLAGHSEARERRRRLGAWVAAGAVGVLGAVWLVGMGISAWNNHEGLQRALAQVGRAAERVALVNQAGAPATLKEELGTDLERLVDALDAMRQVGPAVYNPVGEPAASYRAGLYQGQLLDEQVGGQSYRPALQKGLLPRIALQLESMLQDPSTPPDQLYQALKAYRMMYDADKHLNTEWFASAVDSLWGIRQLDPVLVKRARVHLLELMKSRDLQAQEFHPANLSLVKSAQQRAAATPLVRRLAAQLKLAGQGVGTPLVDILGPSGEQWLERASGAHLAEPIPFAYTAEGYHAAVKPELMSLVAASTEEERWVLGPYAATRATDPSQLAADVLSQYFIDATGYWETLLRDIRLRRLATPAETVQAARALASPNTPLRGLADAVANQTRFATRPADAGAAAASAAAEFRKAAAEAVASRAVSKVSSIFGGVGVTLPTLASPDEQMRRLERQAEDRFKDLRRFAAPGQGGVDDLRKLLDMLAIDLAALQQRRASGQAVMEVPAAVALTEQRASEFPEPVPGILKALTGQGQAAAKEGLAAEAKMGVANASATCRRVLAGGGYPFQRASQKDIGIKDFAAVFRAGGELDQHFNTRLAPYVDKSAGVWKLRAGAESTVPLKPGTLAQFQRADAIRNAFLAGGAQPDVSVTVRVLEATGEVSIDVDGRPQPMPLGADLTLKWPSPRLTAQLMLAGSPAARSEGEWALFRLLDQGQRDETAGGSVVRVRYTAKAGSASALLEWRSGSGAFNPLRLPELAAFGCPVE